MARDAEVRSRLERVEEIVERLEAGECSRSEAEALYEEGQRKLQEVRNLSDGDLGSVIDVHLNDSKK